MSYVASISRNKDFFRETTRNSHIPDSALCGQ